MFKRMRMRKKLKSGSGVDITQKELHELFQLGEFDPSTAYSAFVKTVLTAVFFWPILPLGVPLAVLGLLLLYYGFKKQLLRDSRNPTPISSDIALVTIYLLNLVPFAYGVTPV